MIERRGAMLSYRATGIKAGAKKGISQKVRGAHPSASMRRAVPRGSSNPLGAPGTSAIFRESVPLSIATRGKCVPPAEAFVGQLAAEPGSAARQQVMAVREFLLTETLRGIEERDARLAR